MLVDRMADYLAEKTGVGVAGKDSLFDAAETWLRGAAAHVAPDAKDLDDDTLSKIYQGLGSAPGAIAEFMVGGRLLRSGVAGFAGVEALHSAHEGMAEAAKEAVKGALFGGALKGTEHLTRAGRVAGMGTLGATTAAAEGGDVGDVTSSGVVMGALGAPGRAGGIRVRDLYRKSAEISVESEALPPEETATEPKPPPAGPEAPVEPPVAEPKKRGRLAKVPRSQAELERMLDSADRQRNARKLSKADRERAKELQDQTEMELARLEAETLTVNDPEQRIGFTLNTVSGQKTIFDLPAVPEVVKGLKKRLLGPKNAGKFFAEEPPRRDFVTASDGTVDFGELPGAFAEATNQVAGPVRLLEGREKHIEAAHGGEIRAAGYADVRALVEDVGRNYVAVNEMENGDLVLVKRNGIAKLAFVRLIPDREGNFWNVGSARVQGSGRSIPGAPIWEPPRGSGPTEPGSSGPLPSTPPATKPGVGRQRVSQTDAGSLRAQPRQPAL